MSATPPGSAPLPCSVHLACCSSHPALPTPCLRCWAALQSWPAARLHPCCRSAAWAAAACSRRRPSRWRRPQASPMGAPCVCEAWRCSRRRGEMRPLTLGCCWQLRSRARPRLSSAPPCPRSFMAAPSSSCGYAATGCHPLLCRPPQRRRAALPPQWQPPCQLQQQRQLHLRRRQPQQHHQRSTLCGRCSTLWLTCELR